MEAIAILTDHMGTLTVGGFPAGGTYFQGAIAAVLVSSRRLSAREDAAVIAYLTDTYGLDAA